MAKFQVTTAELKAAIADLQEKNGTFKNKVSELEQSQQALRAQWQGDANTVFNTAFENDKAQWTTFSTLIDQYIQALQTILQTYEQAEATNTSTASNRSY
ncbi:WXG100 family type VII secretion target [Oliverpabstia intestinalis]|uniref:WXG100 family type VII secretion target n=1 Tax=Oliverpabstia intestinalis TaxID=2606633 RepID=UPI003F997646